MNMMLMKIMRAHGFSVDKDHHLGKGAQKQILPPFFLSEIKPLIGETNFTLRPNLVSEDQKGQTPCVFLSDAKGIDLEEAMFFMVFRGFP